MVTSCDYIVKPKFISQNMDFFERYLKDETPKGIDHDCDYLPCHKKLESCDFCYCPFYPCADGLTGGEWIKGKNVWSCQHCDWIHLEEPCKAIREGLDDILKEPNDLKKKHIELLKLRRECLLKTLKWMKLEDLLKTWNEWNWGVFWRPKWIINNYTYLL